jgi:pimeloyl-ACP methyl ester carboxylesterase
MSCRIAIARSRRFLGGASVFNRSSLALISYGLLVGPSDVRAEDHFLDSNGVRIHYIVVGEGEPVLLIHGFSVDIGRNWAAPGIIKALSRDYQVIALDNRGHGQSDRPHDPKKYGAEMTEDAVRLLDHLKIDKAHVVGYSMGGRITAELLASHPDRLLTATLGGFGAIRSDPEQMRFWGELADSLEQGRGIGPLLVRLTPPGRPKPTEAEIAAVNARINATGDMKALAALVRGSQRTALTREKQRANPVPTLGLVGSIDVGALAGAEDLKQHMANYDLVVIEGADHMNAVGRPQFIKSLKQFLAKHSQKRKNEKSGTSGQ